VKHPVTLKEFIVVWIGRNVLFVHIVTEMAGGHTPVRLNAFAGAPRKCFAEGQS
jgi:hypothetical protein